jgi:uncharacterized UPF0160 family protein
MSSSPTKRSKPVAVTTTTTLNDIQQSLITSIHNLTITSTRPSSQDELQQALITHSGHFHCDEALAIAMLLILPEHQPPARILIRTRDLSLIDAGYLVVDVGAKFNVENRRFDHHQRGFEETIGLPNKTTKLSSAGLVYKYFGKNIIKILFGNDEFVNNNEQIINNILYEKLYSGFIEHIDGIDNGIEAYDGKRNYTVSTTLSSRVGYLSPAWHEVSDEKDENERFRLAIELTGMEFIQHLYRLVKDWLPARQFVENAIKRAGEEHPSNQVIRLEKSCPWKEHLFDLEVELNKPGFFLYVLYPDGPTSYRVSAVPEKGNEFASRKALPERLRGLRDDVLSKAAGISDLIFVHGAGFIGGAKSLEGARKLAGLGLGESEM